MHTRHIGGALALATTLLVASCGSSTISTVQSSMPTDPSTSVDGTASQPMATMDMGGAASSNHGLNLYVVTTDIASTQSTQLSFRVMNVDGSALTTFQEEQTKLLHLILVRSDLSDYHHVHPLMRGDGTWTVPVTFAQGGSYRMVADFVPVLDGKAASRTAITADLSVTGEGTDIVLPDPATTAAVDEYTVQLAGDLTSGTESELTFTIVDKAGEPVVLEPYLGAYGHLVAFAQSDLAYTHIHPTSADEANGALTFLGQVTAPGVHRLFMQFAAKGTVHTAEFTIDAV